MYFRKVIPVFLLMVLLCFCLSACQRTGVSDPAETSVKNETVLENSIETESSASAENTTESAATESSAPTESATEPTETEPASTSTI